MLKSHSNLTLCNCHSAEPWTFHSSPSMQQEVASACLERQIHDKHTSDIFKNNLYPTDCSLGSRIGLVGGPKSWEPLCHSYLWDGVAQLERTAFHRKSAKLIQGLCLVFHKSKHCLPGRLTSETKTKKPPTATGV